MAPELCEGVVRWCGKYAGPRVGGRRGPLVDLAPEEIEADRPRIWADCGQGGQGEGGGGEGGFWRAGDGTGLV